ncbi:MAG: RNA polymerase sigma factor [Myxococcota bacterium]
MDESSDQELVAMALRGDDVAFSRLYYRYAPRLARRLGALGRGDADTADVLQKAFLEIHRTLGRYRPDASFSAWVQAIAYRVWRTHLRGRRRRAWMVSVSPEHFDNQHDDQDPSAAELSDRGELGRHLRRLLGELPVDKQIAYALHELEGLGVTEIGELVGASPQTIWARVSSARRALEKALGELYLPTGAPASSPAERT